MGGRGSASAISAERMRADAEAIMARRGGIAADSAPVFTAIENILRRENHGPDGYVRLPAIRAELAHAGLKTREAQDRALEAFSRHPRGYLIPIANLKSLTDSDKAAALRLGTQDVHAARILPS